MEKSKLLLLKELKMKWGESDPRPRWWVEVQQLIVACCIAGASREEILIAINEDDAPPTTA